MAQSTPGVRSATAGMAMPRGPGSYANESRQHVASRSGLTASKTDPRPGPAHSGSRGVRHEVVDDDDDEAEGGRSSITGSRLIRKKGWTKSGVREQIPGSSDSIEVAAAAAHRDNDAADTTTATTAAADTTSHDECDAAATPAPAPVSVAAVGAGGDPYQAPGGSSNAKKRRLPRQSYLDEILAERAEKKRKREKKKKGKSEVEQEPA